MRSWSSRICSHSNPLLERSIQNRFPYLDPLNHVQVELLKLHRAPRVQREGADGHPAHDQRRFGGPAEQRVRNAGLPSAG